MKGLVATALVAVVMSTGPTRSVQAAESCAQLNDRIFGSDGHGGDAARFHALKAKIDAEVAAGQTTAAAKDQAAYAKLAASIVANARLLKRASCKPRIIASHEQTFADGTIVGLQPGTKNEWLDGRTLDGTVGLAPNLAAPYTGALWRLHLNADRSVNIESLGNLSGPHWLYGATINGSVTLAPTPKGRTGASWLLVPVQGDTFRVKCLGRVEGARWLNYDGTQIKLVADANSTGNLWRITRRAPPQ